MPNFGNRIQSILLTKSVQIKSIICSRGTKWNEFSWGLSNWSKRNQRGWMYQRSSQLPKRQSGAKHFHYQFMWSSRNLTMFLLMTSHLDFLRCMRGMNSKLIWRLRCPQSIGHCIRWARSSSKRPKGKLRACSSTASSDHRILPTVPQSCSYPRRMGAFGFAFTIVGWTRKRSRTNIHSLYWRNRLAGWGAQSRDVPWQNRSVKNCR